MVLVILGQVLTLMHYIFDLELNVCNFFFLLMQLKLVNS